MWLRCNAGGNSKKKNDSCPSCRVECLKTRRSLRRDKSMDAIIVSLRSLAGADADSDSDF